MPLTDTAIRNAKPQSKAVRLFDSGGFILKLPLGAENGGGLNGGLFALYAELKYQNVFSKVAAFSPVLTPSVFGQQLANFIRANEKSAPMQIYLDLGSAELSFGPTEPIRDELLAAGFGIGDVWFRHIANASHRIEHWRQRFPHAMLWLYRYH